MGVQTYRQMAAMPTPVSICPWALANGDASSHFWDWPTAQAERLQSCSWLV